MWPLKSPFSYLNGQLMTGQISLVTWNQWKISLCLPRVLYVCWNTFSALSWASDNFPWSFLPLYTEIQGQPEVRGQDLLWPSLSVHTDKIMCAVLTHPWPPRSPGTCWAFLSSYKYLMLQVLFLNSLVRLSFAPTVIDDLRQLKS